MGHGGGYLVSSSHRLEHDVPIENTLAMIEEVQGVRGLSAAGGAAAPVRIPARATSPGPGTGRRGRKRRPKPEAVEREAAEARTAQS